MEPFTLFVTLAPYLIGYAKEKAEQKKYTIEDFQDWLIKNHHNKMEKAIQENQGLLAGIKIILKGNHSETLDKFDKLEKILSSAIANTVVGSELAKAINPVLLLSEQAISILIQMNKDEVEALCINHTLNLDRRLLYMRAPVNGEIKDLDARFLLDDLNQLVKLGYLTININQQGEDVYFITRKGSSII